MTSFARTAAVLALALAVAAPSALAAGDGTYKGKITGNTKVTVKVKNNRVTKFTTSLYASCGLSNFIITVAFPPSGQKGRSAKITNGKFKAVFKGSPDVEDDRRTIKGTFDGKKVKGSVRVRGLCSADGKYSAKR
jgi:hypothetical protein